jgi:hypothetical protein
MLDRGRAVLALMGAGRLAHGEWRLESDGPEVALTTTGTDACLDAHGRGEVRVFRGNKGTAAFVNAQARQRIIL